MTGMVTRAITLPTSVPEASTAMFLKIEPAGVSVRNLVEIQFLIVSPFWEIGACDRINVVSVCCDEM
jgi:hypothetical protein